MEWEKVPNIPPLLVNNKLVTEFEAKANIPNKYFDSQCTTINSNSVIPLILLGTFYPISSFFLPSFKLFN